MRAREVWTKSGRTALKCLSKHGNVKIVTFACFVNEREEFMQETQHTQQAHKQHKTKTRKQQECKWLKNTEDTQKQTNIY